MRSKLPGAVVAVAALVAAGLVAAVQPAGAATIAVTTTADVVNGGDGVTSLREAFMASISSPGADTVQLEAAATYQLTACASGALVDGATDDLTVEGNGATIDQTCAGSRVITKTQSSGTLTLADLTLTGAGSAGPSLDGAAVLSAGHLVLEAVVVTGIPNDDFGTAVEVDNGPAVQDVEVIGSTITGNGGRGVGNVAIGGGVRIDGSTITDNSGGGVDLTDGTPLVVHDSVVSGNGGYGVRTTGQGSTTLEVTSSTVADNSSTGITCSACGEVVVQGTTVSGNGLVAGPGVGGGIAVSTDQDDAADAPTVTISDSTITGNVAQRDGGGIAVTPVEAHDAAQHAVTTVTTSTVDGNSSVCPDCDGGGISANVGSLLVADAQVSGNSTSGDGGGIHQDRRDGDTIAGPTSFALTASTVSSNTADGDGGGVSAHAGVLAVTDSVVEGNSAGVGGGLALGGIFTAQLVQSGAATVTSSTVTGNQATTHGGGLALRYPDGSNATVVNSTMHANSAAVGGGVAAGLTEPLTLRYSTLTANSAATGANLASSSVTTVGATAIAEPAGGGSNCSPFPGFGTSRVSEGYSWFSDDSCEAGPADVAEVGGDAQLGALGDNGGPTPTRLPAATSPLGGLVPGGACDVATDQRGELRPAGDGCEAGSVEVEEVPAVTPIVGTPWPDVLVGTAGDDEVHGLGATDLLVGEAGDDLLDGGSGWDLLVGGPGDDVLVGGPGWDVLVGGPGDDTLVGGPGVDVLIGDGGNDSYDGGPGLDLCFLPNQLLPELC